MSIRHYCDRCDEYIVISAVSRTPVLGYGDKCLCQKCERELRALIKEWLFPKVGD